MYEIILSKNAQKVYSSVDDNTARRLNKAFDDMADNPFFGKNIKKLKGKLEGLYRYRVGEYRLVYELNEKQIHVYVLWIGKRKDAYK